jgi:hypothetical protein
LLWRYKGMLLICNQVAGSYPGGWPKDRAPPLPFTNPHLWEDDTESAHTSTREDSPARSTNHAQTASEVSVEPRPSTPSGPSVNITSEDVAFAALTKTMKDQASEIEAVQVERILEELQASRERRVEYTSLKGAEARILLDALQLVGLSSRVQNVPLILISGLIPTSRTSTDERLSVS